MNHKIKLGWALLALALAVLLTFMLTYNAVAGRYNYKLSGAQASNAMFTKLDQVDQIVRSNFIGAASINDTALSDSIISGYIAGIGDKYARYLNQAAFAAFQATNSGSMSGIGVTVTSSADGASIEVVSVSPGSPAEAAGLLAGDLIYKVDDTLVSDVGYDQAVNLIKGASGTDVTLDVYRPDASAADATDSTADMQSLTFTITRGTISTPSVQYNVIDSNSSEIGYIRITSFTQTTPDDFKAAMDALIAQGVGKFIFDVRSNPGGDLGGIERTLDMLLPEGPIVHIIDKDGKDTTVSSDAACYTGKFTVLVNGGTASAAELFTAALRDYKLATIIGSTTFGKGTVQTVMSLGDGTAISISTSMFNPPFGDNFEGVGITPDIVLPLPDDQQALFAQQNLPQSDDAQIQKAIQVLEQ